MLPGTVERVGRVMQIEQWAIDKLVPYARNPRRNDHAIDRLASMIREFGFRIPIIAKSDGSVVDGHLRLKAAKKLGLDTVPVVLADDLNDAQIKALRLAINKSYEFAEWDLDLLKLELEELHSFDFDLGLTGFDADSLTEIMYGPSFEPVSEDEQPRLDEKKKVICPECGAEFEPK